MSLQIKGDCSEFTKADCGACSDFVKENCGDFVEASSQKGDCGDW